MKVRVYHSLFGCETGCCGHIIELEGQGHEFLFAHPWDAAGEEDHAKWAREVAEQIIGEHWPACLDSIDWDTFEYDVRTE